MKRSGISKFRILAAILITLTGPAFAAREAGFFLNMRVYVHTPDVFADRWVGRMNEDPRIPMSVHPNDVWYVKYQGYLNFANLPYLVDLVKQRHIPGLDLSDQRDIVNLDMEQLRVLTDLRYLSIAGTNVTDRGLGYFFTLQNVRVLTLNSLITDDGVENLLRMENLQELNLAGARITDRGVAMLVAFPNLQRLDIGDAPVTDQGLQSLTHMPLRQLRLGSGITDKGLKILRAIPTLVQLELRKTQVTDKGLASLSAFPLLHTLFTNRLLTDKGVQMIAQRHSLRRLDLTGAAITDAGVQQLSKLTELEELSLANTGTTDAGLAGIASLSHLRFLEVSDSSVTLAGIEKLTSLKNLEVISFSSRSPLKLGALKPLAAMPALRTIIVNGQALPSEAMQLLKKEGPKISRLNCFIPDLFADDLPTPITDDTDVAHLKGVSAIEVAGLPRIHSVESQLDEVIVAPPTIGQDNQEDTQSNFLGEFNVDAGPGKKPHSTPSAQALEPS